MPPLTRRFPSRLADPLGSADPLGWHRGRPGASFGDAGAASPRCSPRGMDPAGSPRGPPRLQPRGGRGGCGRSSTAPLRSRWSLRGGAGGGSASLADPGQRSEREREPRAPPLGRAGGTRWGGGFAAPSSPAAQGSAHPGPGTPPGRDEGLRWSGGAGCGGAGLLAARGWADLPRPQRAVIFPSGWFIRYDECRQEREPTIG